MNNRILERASTLLAQGVPFALATVVRRERPTSGEPGDKAIITSDGEFLGWIGGRWAQPPVVPGAEKGIDHGQPRPGVFKPQLPEGARQGAGIYPVTRF